MKLRTLCLVLLCNASVFAQQTTSYQKWNGWHPHDEVEWTFITTQYPLKQSPPVSDTAFYSLKVERISGDSLFCVIRDATEEKKAPFTDTVGGEETTPIVYQYSRWIGSTTLDIVVLSSNGRLVTVVPRAPSSGLLESNKRRDVPHSHEQLLEYTRKQMFSFWPMLRPNIPDSVLRSRNREILDITITTDTSSRYNAVATGSQPVDVISVDTLTKTWIVRDVVGDDVQTYVDVSMKKRDSRWPLQFVERFRFDQLSMPPYLPAYSDGGSDNLGAPGTLRIEVIARYKSKDLQK
jgi:hypothetical protein